MDVVEFHSADLLQLLLDPSPGFQGIFEALTDVLLFERAMRKKQLEQARDRFANRNRVALIEIISQLEEPINGIGKAALAHFAHEFGEVIGDQTVTIGEKFRPHLRHFPAWDVGVEAVEKRAVDHGLWKWCQKVTGLHQSVDGLIDVSDENHAGRCRN